MDIWISPQLLFEDLRNTTSLKGSILGATERIKQIVVATQNAYKPGLEISLKLMKQTTHNQ